MNCLKLVASALALSLVLGAMPAQAADRYIGEVFTMAGSFCPEGSLEADGRLLPVAQNQALFSLLENRYGGDGRKEFALPDLRPDKKPWTRGQPRQCIALQGDYPPMPD